MSNDADENDSLEPFDSATLVIDTEGDGQEVVTPGELSGVSLSVDNSTDGEVVIDRDLPDEIEFSCDIDIGTQTVVCPACNVANHVPPSPFLSASTDGPVPCVSCGYPLL